MISLIDIHVMLWTVKKKSFSIKRGLSNNSLDIHVMLSSVKKDSFRWTLKQASRFMLGPKRHNCSTQQFIVKFYTGNKDNFSERDKQLLSNIEKVLKTLRSKLSKLVKFIEDEALDELK